jgi:glycosyltransferase involved in cell wall biosynthesis
MKIAIFHNFMDNIGGAEIVSLTLARHFDACIYTTNFDTDKISAMGFGDVVPRIRSIGSVPKNAPYKQQCTLYRFRKLKLTEAHDFYIISGDWAMSAAVNHHPNLWYAHSPLNELWEFKEYIRDTILSLWQKPLFEAWVNLNRMLTLRYARSVDRWACNSKNTRDRVRRFYKMDPEVIYPPIGTQEYRHGGSKGYWLSVNRLFKNKRVELQLDAFGQMKDKKLVIVGSYEVGSRHFEEYARTMKKKQEPNVEMKHWVGHEELRDLYAHCTGFITTSFKEDFGMAAVEALASGKPVIAPNEGGYRESVIDGATGALLQDTLPDTIKKAVKNVEANIRKNPLHYKERCIAQAKNFDKDIFIKKISSIVAGRI